MKQNLLFAIILLWNYSITCQSIDYETEIQPIFNNSCMPCHGGTNPSSGLDLASYDRLGDDCDPMPLNTYELTHSKEIIKIMNLSGQESRKKQNTLIYIYNDGSIQKTRQLE